MLYPWDSILMRMTNLLICTFIHLKHIAFFKKAHKHAYPRTVTEPLKIHIDTLPMIRSKL